MGKQQERVLNYMSDYGSVSSLEAFRDLGVTRLSAVIFNLKRKGVKIKKVKRKFCLFLSCNICFLWYNEL